VKSRVSSKYNPNFPCLFFYFEKKKSYNLDTVFQRTEILVHDGPSKAAAKPTYSHAQDRGNPDVSYHVVLHGIIKASHPPSHSSSVRHSVAPGSSR
jgi:hypothetical protein